MAETQNVFVTKTQNRFLPIIQAFTDNLYKHMQMQGELNEKQIAFNKQRQGEDFISQYGKKITQAKSLEELTSTLSTAVTDAGSKGLTNALPVIQSIAQVHQQSIGLEEANRQANEYVGLLEKTYGGSMVLQDGKPVPFKDAVISLNDIKDPISRRMNAEFLAKNILKEYKDVVPEGKGYKYTSGFVGADGKTYDIQQYNIIEDKKRGVLIDSDKTTGVSEGDLPLDPLVAKQYGLYKKQDKQLESYMSRVGSGGGYVNTQPSTYYDFKDKNGKYIAVPAWWEKKMNRYRMINPDTNQEMDVPGNITKPYKQTTEFQTKQTEFAGIIGDLSKLAEKTVQSYAVGQSMVYGTNWADDTPITNLNFLGQKVAAEIGDNWENPTNPELKRIKQKINGANLNPFKQEFIGAFGVKVDSSNVDYYNNTLK